MSSDFAPDVFLHPWSCAHVYSGLVHGALVLFGKVANSGLRVVLSIIEHGPTAAAWWHAS